MLPENSSEPKNSQVPVNRRQLLAPASLTILLTIGLVALGYLIFAQSRIAGGTIQDLAANLLRLFPLSVESLSLFLPEIVYPLFWIILSISWLISIFALVLSRFSQTVMLILVGLATFLIFLTVPFLFSGLVLLSEIVLLFLVGLAGNLSFSERITARFMTIAIGIGMVALILDIFIPWQRPQPLSGNLLYILYVLFLLGFAIVVAFGFWRYPLRQKLIFAVMIVSVASIVAVALVSIRNVEESIQNTARQALLIAASQTIANVEGFMSDAIITLESEAQNDAYVDFLSARDEDRTDEMVLLANLELQNFLNRREYSTREAVTHLRFLQGAGLVDKYGTVLLDTNEDDIGQSRLEDPAFVKAFVSQEPYISTIRYDLAGSPLLFLSKQIKASDGSMIGVLITRYDGNALQEIISDSGNLAGSGSYAILAEPDYYIQLANGQNPDLNFRTPLPADEQMIANIRAEGLVPSISGSSISTNQTQYVEGLKQAQSGWDLFLQAQVFAGARLANLPEDERAQEQALIEGELRSLQEDLSFTFPDPITDEIYLAAYSGMKLVPWVVVYSQSREYFLLPLQSQVQNIQLLALAVVLGAAGLAFVVSQILAAPIGSLTRVASSIAMGDFSIKAPVGSDDEIGKLAVTVNTMADQLSSTLEGLEQKVYDRTSELTRRSEQMQAAVEVGRAAANLRNITELLPQVCHLISERFGFYHAGIFLLDPSGTFAVLRAANSEGGQHMLARGHRLQVGQQGIVGFVTATGQPRIALDVGEDAVFFNNPDLPQTRSEAALPLQSGGRIFGALDVQSIEASAFAEEDINVLRVMADLVATAIENARLFEENQRALEVSRRAYGEISRQSWSDILQSQPEYGYLSTQAGVFPSHRVFNETSVDESDTSQDYTLSIPIWVQNSILGYIKTKKPHEKGPWTNDEIEAVAKVVEQMGIALESARIYKSSQVQADRERTITDITSRMRESLDVDAVLRVASEQIRQVLDLKRVTVALGADIAAGVEDSGG